MEGRRRGFLFLLSSLIIAGGFFYFPLPDVRQRESREALAKWDWLDQVSRLGLMTGFVSTANAAEQDVIITEIMYNPSGADAKHEWVELKNLGSATATIVGGSTNQAWRIFDGSNHTLATSTTLGAGQYLVVAQDTATFLTDHPGFSGLLVQSSALNLVNTSSTVALRVGSSGPLWSEVNYFNTWGADGNGKTLEKKNAAGPNTADNWQESAPSGGTPGAANSSSGGSAPPPSPSPAPAEEPAPVRLMVEDKPAYEVGSLVINEFVSDPNDGEDEWVELSNRLSTSLDLTGWRLEDGSEEETPLNGVISGQGFLVIKNPKGRLNNSGDVLVLKDTKGQVINQVVYGKWDSGPNNRHAPAAYNGESTARLSNGFSGNDNNDFFVTSLLTPGAENLLGSRAPSSANQDSAITTAARSIILNELLPNGSGADDQAEFIEVKNISQGVLDLQGYFIKNGTSQFTVATSTPLLPAGLIIFKRPQTGLVLKNSGTAKIQLFNNQKLLIDEVGYDGQVLENISYSRVNSSSTSWLWSAVPTPGRENVMQAVNRLPLPNVSWPATVAVGESAVFDASDSSDPDGDELLYEWEFGDKQTATGEVVSRIFQKAKSYRVILWLSDQQGHRVPWRGTVQVSGEVSEERSPSRQPAGGGSAFVKKTGLRPGQLVRVRGRVTVWPGVLGSQIFYLQSDNGAYQVYSHKKDFPKLAIGDLVEVSGTLSQVLELPRLKIKQASDVRVLSADHPVEPIVSNVDELSEELLGSLIKVEGEAAEPKKSGFYLIDDSGELAVVYKKTAGLVGQLVKEGDHLSVTGLLTATKSGYRLEPRGVSDIAVLASAETQTPASPGQNKKYLGLTASGLGSALAAWLLRSRSALIKTAMVGALARSPWKKNRIK